MKAIVIFTVLAVCAVAGVQATSNLVFPWATPSNPVWVKYALTPLSAAQLATTWTNDPNFGTMTALPMANTQSAYCSQLAAYYPPGSTFPLNNRLYVQKKFFVDTVASYSATLTLIVDNDIEAIYVNGNRVGPSSPTTVVRDGCGGVSTQWTFTFDGSHVQVGWNYLAIKVSDRGGAAFFNFHMTHTAKANDQPPQPNCVKIAWGTTDAPTAGFLVSNSTTLPTSWNTAVDAASTPFGKRNSNFCTQLSSRGWVPTSYKWAIGTTIFVRKTFVNGDVLPIEYLNKMSVVVDNDLLGVWLNGVQVFGAFPIRDNCGGVSAELNFSLPPAYIYTGVNEVVFKIRDRGDQSFFNVAFSDNSDCGATTTEDYDGNNEQDVETGGHTVCLKGKYLPK